MEVEWLGTVTLVIHLGGGGGVDDWLGTVTSIKRSLIDVHLGLCFDWLGTVTSIKK